MTVNQPLSSIQHLLAMILLLGGVTVCVEWLLLDLSALASVVLYLLTVIIAAYYFSPTWSLLTAVLSYLLLNYLVVAPRYAFRQSDLESGVILLVYVLTAWRVNSLVRTLRSKSSALEDLLRLQQFSANLLKALADVDSPSLALDWVCRELNSRLGTAFEPRIVAHPKLGAGVIGRLLQVSMDGQLHWLLPCSPQTNGAWQVLSAVVLNPGEAAQAERYGALAIQHLRQALDRLNQSQRAHQAQLLAHEEEVRSRLLASISHDMRTPLTVILGAATTLNTQWPKLPQSKVQGLLESIESEAFHMAASAENVLSLIKLGRLKTLPEPPDTLSLAEVIEVTARRYAKRHPPVNLEVDIPNLPLLVRGDSGLLSQALANLIDNAHAIQPVNQAVVLFARVLSGRQVCLGVRDFGPGFPEGFAVSRIQPFQKLSSQTNTGFGLGLSIVKLIAELHGADLKMVNNSHGGTEVYMQLNCESMEWSE